MMEIRKESISYSSKKKRERVAEEIKILHEIELLETKIDAEENKDELINIDTELPMKKTELGAIYAHQALGAYVRSRSKHILEGEKPTRLFCALERHNAVQKHVPRLLIEKDSSKIEVTQQKKIEEEICSYYQDLFSEKPVEDVEISDFLGSHVEMQCKRLTEEQKK